MLLVEKQLIISLRSLEELEEKDRKDVHALVLLVQGNKELDLEKFDFLVEYYREYLNKYDMDKLKTQRELV